MRRDLGPVGVWASQLGLVPADDAGAAARRIEELGYGTIWVGEADGRHALLHAGMLLEATEQVTVATGIANIWARDAQATINGARTLAEAYDGRFVLGIGASHAPLVERRGREYGKPYSEMVRYLAAMREADYTSPRPAQEPDVVLAALGPKMLALAAEEADGAHTFLVPVAHTARARQAMGEGPVVAPEQAAAVAEDRSAARALAEDHVRKYLSLPNYRRNLERLGYPEEELDAVSDRVFDDLVAWGGHDRIVERVREHHAAGADHVALHVLTESPTRLPLEELEALAEAIG